MKERPARIHELLRHERFALRFARRVAGDPHSAEDLVQQAWLRAIQSPPRNWALQGWVRRVVVNLARSRYRARERREQVERFAVGGQEAVVSSAAAEAAELRAVLDCALDRISEPNREAIRLRYSEGLQPREIALHLGVPLETVYTRLQRGLRDLRRVLGPRRASDRLAWGIALLGLGLHLDWLRGRRVELAVPVATAAAGALLFVLVATRGPAGARDARVAAAPVGADPTELAALSLDVPQDARTLASGAPVPIDASVPAPDAPPAGRSGIVIDVHKKPVAGASIWVAPADAPGEAREVTRSAGDGTFVVTGVEREGWIGARAASSCSSLYYADDPAHTERGRFELCILDALLEPFGGTVRDADGAPVAGARVSVPTDALPRARINRDGCLQHPFVPEPVSTDEEGRYEIPSLPLGVQRIRIDAAGFARAEVPVNQRTRSKPGRRGWDVVLEEERTVAGSVLIRGRALDEAGLPLCEHVVQLRALSDLVPPTTPVGLDVVASTFTDAAGRFELAVERAAGHRLELLARAEDAGPARVVLASAPIRAQPDLGVLELRARHTPLVGVGGRVVGLPGQDLAHVRITLRSTGLVGSLVLRPDPVTGAFECSAVPAGEVQVGAWTPGLYRPAVLTADARGPWTDVGAVLAELPGSVRVDLAPAPGADLEGLWVVLRLEGRSAIRLSEDAMSESGEIRDGAAWFWRVPPGKHRVEVGGATIGQTVVPIQVVAGEEAWAEARPEPGIRCRLTWPPEHSGATEITIRMAGGAEVHRRPAKSAAGGLCRLELLLPPGSYVAALIGEDGTLEVPFRVGPESAADGVDVLLAR